LLLGTVRVRRRSREVRINNKDAEEVSRQAPYNARFGYQRGSAGTHVRSRRFVTQRLPGGKRAFQRFSPLPTSSKRLPAPLPPATAASTGTSGRPRDRLTRETPRPGRAAWPELARNSSNLFSSAERAPAGRGRGPQRRGGPERGLGGKSLADDGSCVGGVRGVTARAPHLLTHRTGGAPLEERLGTRYERVGSPLEIGLAATLA